MNGLMHHCREQLSRYQRRHAPRHCPPIDMDTTGVLIVCKNDLAHNSIAEQLKVHSITRKYYAVVFGSLKDDEGTIRAPIGHHPNDRKKMSINSKNGKDAVTHYKVLERFHGYTLVECRLETGRTHQIRYTWQASDIRFWRSGIWPGETALPFTGQTPHAGVPGFHPRTGEYMEFSAPLPKYFEELLEKLRRFNLIRPAMPPAAFWRGEE